MAAPLRGSRSDWRYRILTDSKTYILDGASPLLQQSAGAIPPGKTSEPHILLFAHKRKAQTLAVIQAQGQVTAANLPLLATSISPPPFNSSYNDLWPNPPLRRYSRSLWDVGHQTALLIVADQPGYATLTDTYANGALLTDAFSNGGILTDAYSNGATLTDGQ